MQQSLSFPTQLQPTSESPAARRYDDAFARFNAAQTPAEIEHWGKVLEQARNAMIQEKVHASLGWQS